MTAVLIAGLAAATLAVLRARLYTATVVLFGTLFLVPGNLVFPGFHSVAPAFRVVMWSYLAGLVLRAARGEIDPAAFRPTRVQWALVAFLAVALVNGIALNPVDNGSVNAGLRWVSFLDHLVVLTAVLVCSRVLGVWQVARIVAGFAVVVGGVAVWEHFSETSYARWWFEQVGRTDVRAASSVLQRRAGEVRVRGPYQFALEFSWVAVMVMPLVVQVASRARHRLALVGPGLLGLALLWSWSRSAWPGLALGLAVLAVASLRDRRTLVAVGAVALVAVAVLLVNPGVRSPLDDAEEDSAESRTRRLALITEEIAPHPYTGVGLAGANARGFYGADSTYVLVYAFVGVPGVVTLAVAHATAIGTCLAGLLSRRSRAVAAAALAGVVAAMLGNFALDLVATPGTGKLLWILAGLGAAAASGVDRPPLPRRRSRLLAVPAALGVGVVVATVWPTHAAATFRFETIEARELAGAIGNVEWGGHHLVNTACDLIEVREDALPPGRVDCIDAREAAGIGYLRVQTGDRASTSALSDAIETEVAATLAGFELHQVHAEEALPTPLRTLPVWLPALALAAVWLVPRWPWVAVQVPPDEEAPPASDRAGTTSSPASVPGRLRDDLSRTSRVRSRTFWDGRGRRSASVASHVTEHDER